MGSGKLFKKNRDKTYEMSITLDQFRHFEEDEKGKATEVSNILTKRQVDKVDERIDMLVSRSKLIM